MRFKKSIGIKQKGPAEQVAPRVSSLKFADFECVFPIVPWRKYDSQRPLFGGDFLGQILAADSLPGAFVHSRKEVKMRQKGGLIKVETLSFLSLFLERGKKTTRKTRIFNS